MLLMYRKGTRYQCSFVSPVETSDLPGSVPSEKSYIRLVHYANFSSSEYNVPKLTVV